MILVCFIFSDLFEFWVLKGCSFLVSLLTLEIGQERPEREGDDAARRPLGKIIKKVELLDGRRSADWLAGM